MLDPMPTERYDFRIAANSALYARSYDRLVGDAAAGAIAAGWRRAQKFLSPPLERAVDIACGTGRFLPELARVARQVYAVDQSPAMLAIARQRAAGLNVRFFQQDMRNLDLPAPCDLATCRFASINYLRSLDDLHRTFAGFRRAVRPNGLLLFDLIVKPANCGEPFQHRQHVSQGRLQSRWDYVVDPCKGVSKTRIEWALPGSPRHAETHRQRWYSEAAITSLLTRHGFSIVDRCWLPRGGPDNWLQLIARRSAGRAAG